MNFVLFCLFVFKYVKSTNVEVGNIDVCDDITLSFRLTIGCTDTIPNGWTYLVGSTESQESISQRYPDVYMGEGFSGIFNNKPFLHFAIGVGNTQRVLNIDSLESNTAYDIIVSITSNNMCVSINTVDKGCVTLNGHNTAKQVTYEKNNDLIFGSISNVTIESCIENVRILDICDNINYLFELDIIGTIPSEWSFVAGTVFDYRNSLLDDRLSVWINNNNSSPFLHFTIGSGTGQIYFNIIGLSIGTYSVNVVVSSTQMCATITSIDGTDITECTTFSTHYTGNDVIFRKSIGYSSLFQVGCVSVSSSCDTESSAKSSIIMDDTNNIIKRMQNEIDNLKNNNNNNNIPNGIYYNNINVTYLVIFIIGIILLLILCILFMIGFFICVTSKKKLKSYSVLTETNTDAC